MTFCSKFFAELDAWEIYGYHQEKYWIIDNDAKVRNHYETILKWHAEDTGIKKGATGFNDNNFSCLTKSNPKTVVDDENIRARAEALKQQLSV